MEEVQERPMRVIPVTLERDMRVIREAVAMVASGSATRVTLVGFSLGETPLDLGRRLALEAGVRLVRLWRDDETAVDVAVERIRE